MPRGVDSYGVDFGIDAHLPNGVRGFASATIQQTVQRNASSPLLALSGDPIENSPNVYGHAALSVPLTKRAFLARQVSFIGARLARDRTTNLVTVPVDPHLFTSLILTLPRVWRELDVLVGIYNLIDQRWSDPAGIELPQPEVTQDGRTFLVRLSYGL